MRSTDFTGSGFVKQFVDRRKYSFLQSFLQLYLVLPKT